MAGGYWHDPQGIDGVVRILRSLQRQIDDVRGSAGIKSAILRGDKVEFQNESGDAVVRIGRSNDPGSGLWGITVYDPNTGATVFWTLADTNDNTSWVILGNGADGVGSGTWDLDEFQVRAEAVRFGGSASSAPDPYAPPVDTYEVWSDSVSLVTPEFGLYDLPTTSNAANLYLGTVGGVWTVARVTSSARYKTDIADAAVDPADVLDLPARTWIDKGDAEAAGTMVPKDADVPRSAESDLVPYDPPRQIGFIAEEAWERGTLRQFVKTDADGLPNAFDYDRFGSVGLHAVCKAQQRQIETQQAEIENLNTTVTSLEKRLAALEARA